tara:strand:- start:321 stop:524 length:204 start_codon:yes stop_codon:yes gene_type:complete
MNKTINVGEGTENVEINQTIAQPEPSGPSVGGVSLTTGYGWGVDVGIILLIVGFLYVMKKFVDKWIR